jgi:hypothetical protein
MAELKGTLLEADLVRAALGPLFLIALIVIFYLRKNKAGRLLKTIGVLHVLGGSVVGREPLARIFREGFFGEGDSGLGNVPEHMDKELAFWFMLWGAYIFVIGQLASWAEEEGNVIPASIGWTMVAVNLVAAALYPKGGFWFVLIPAFMIIRRAGRAAPNA